MTSVLIPDATKYLRSVQTDRQQTTDRRITSNVKQSFTTRGMTAKNMYHYVIKVDAQGVANIYKATSWNQLTYSTLGATQ